jgi:hypothetical protein
MSENNQINNWEIKLEDSIDLEIWREISEYYSDLVEQLLEERKRNM